MFVKICTFYNKRQIREVSSYKLHFEFHSKLQMCIELNSLQKYDLANASCYCHYNSCGYY